LLAQGYPSVQAALLGVYLHGLAGDFAASLHSSYSMTSADIVDCLGRAYLSFQEF
jgi:NAD(P)H-hydrate epimerase